MARFKEVELNNLSMDKLGKEINMSSGEIHSYGFGDSYDVALKIFEEQVTDLG